MKLLKKIAPLAVTALMMLGTVGAADLGTWKTTFTASTTAVVVGTGVTNTGDLTAALNLAQAAGIDTNVGSQSVSGESYKFEKSSDKLNLGDELDDIKPTTTSDQLPTLLIDGNYVDDDNNDFDFTQKITVVDNNENLTHFADKDYKDKAPSLGFHYAKDSVIANYTLDFSEEPDCVDLNKTTITFLGKDYYINEALANCAEITLLESGVAGTVVEGETKTIGGLAIAISYVGEDEVVLTVDGKDTNSLEEGETYKLPSGTYVGVKDIRYTTKETGKSSVVISVGKGKIFFDDGEVVELNDEAVDGLTVFIDTDDTTWAGLTLEWALDEESFLTADSSVTMPGIEAIKLVMTGVTFPTGEEIDVEASGDSVAQITVPLKGGDETISLLEDTDADGNFDVIGEEDEYLVTANGTDRTLSLNASTDDAYFVATYYDGDKDAESYYFSFSFSESGDTEYVTLKDETSGSTCKKAGGNTCTFGEVELDIGTVDKDSEWFNVTAGTDVYFDRIFTEEGLWIYLPISAAVTLGKTSVIGGMNITNNTQSIGWTLPTKEENDDNVLGGGDWINFTYNFTSDDSYVAVDDIDTTAWAGGSMLEVDNDNDIGYTESSLATKVEWDESDTNGQYSVKITYFGEEVYGNVYITAAGTSTTAGSGWTPVYDSETGYTTKNVIAIGGSAVNKVARKVLGLDENTVIYGDDTAWQTATTVGTEKVDATGKAILYMKKDVYTTDKWVLLVAGYEGTDTKKAADFLQLTTTGLTGKTKAIVGGTDTFTVQASA